MKNFNIKDYLKAGVILEKLTDLKKGDIVIAKVTKQFTMKGAEMIIESLKGTFPDNKILLMCDGARVSFISKKALNDLGWFYKEKKIISLK